MVLDCTRVVTTKVRVVVPARTVTDTGTVATVVLLEESTMPKLVAGTAVSATSPVLATPPLIELGRMYRLSRAAPGFTVSAAVLVTAAATAVIVTTF